MVAAPTYRARARALLSLGLPLIGGHLGQYAIHATDTLMLGWYDVTALAAGVLGQTLFFLSFLLGAGFAWAVMPMVAAAGAEGGDESTIRRVTRMGLWLSTLYAAVAIPVLLQAEAIFLLLGQPADVSALAGDYLDIAAWGLWPALLMTVLRSYLSALERAQVVLWITLGAAAVNVGVNWVFIFGNLGAPELGIRGAAWASNTVQVVWFGAMALYAARAFAGHALFARMWRPDRAAFVQVFRLGWPIGLTNLAEVGMFSATAVMVGWLGAVPLAAHGIAIQIASATFMVHLGLSNAATIRAGRAFGQRDAAGLGREARLAVAVSGLFAALTVAVFLAVPERLIGLFLDPADPARPEIMALGVPLMAMAALFQLMDAGQVMALGLLRGVQDTRVPMIHATISYWAVGMPASYLFGFVMGWGAVGVWAGLVVGLTCAAALLSHRFWSRALPGTATPVAT